MMQSIFSLADSDFQLFQDSFIGDLITHSLTHWLLHIVEKHNYIDNSESLLALETCDQSEEKTWPIQQKYKDKNKDKDNDNDI